MRYILLKKRRLRLIFIISLVALAISLWAIASQRLLNNFEIYTQKKIAKDFNIEVEIGEINGGFMRPLAFRNIHILRKRNGRPFVSFRTNALLPNYRIWDLVLAQVFGYKELVLILSDGRLYLNSQKPLLAQIEGQVLIDKRQVTQIDLAARRNLDKLSLTGKLKKEKDIPELDLEFAYAKEFTKATFNLKGPLKELKFEGNVFVLDEKKVDFKSSLNILDKKIKIKDASFNEFYLAEGSYDLKNNKFVAKVFCPQEEGKSLTINFNLADDISLDEGNIKPFLLRLNFNHFNLLGQDIVSLLEAKGKLFNNEDEKRHFTFELLTHGTIIEHRPVDELKIFCNYKGGLLNIVWAKWGSEHFASGTIDFGRRPPEIKLVWQINDMDSTDLLMLSNKVNGSEGPLLEGKLNGEICIEGSLFNPVIKIALESKKGNLLGVEFASAYINLRDNYPVLTLHDSRIYREEGGFFILDGKIDLRRTEPTRFLDDIKILSDEKTIILDGWDITRRSDQSGLTLKRAFSEDLKLDFKTFVNEETQDLVNEDAALEFEYRLQGNRSLLIRFEKDSEFFGLKHGSKF